MDIKILLDKYNEKIKELYSKGFSKVSIEGYEKGSVRSAEVATLYSIIRECKYKNILDIGTGKGFSSLWFCQALKDNDFSDGLVDTIDINKNFNENLFGRFGLGSLFNFYQGSSSDVLPKLDKQYDFALIDGEHSYNQSKEDFINIFSKLKVGGMCAFHDIYSRNAPKSGPCDVLQEIEEQNIGKIIYFGADIFDYFSFEEDIKDAERISKKWEQYNYSYVKRGWNPKCLMAIFIKENENLTMKIEENNLITPQNIEE